MLFVQQTRLTSPHFHTFHFLPCTGGANLPSKKVYAEASTAMKYHCTPVILSSHVFCCVPDGKRQAVWACISLSLSLSLSLNIINGVLGGRDGSINGLSIAHQMHQMIDPLILLPYLAIVSELVAEQFALKTFVRISILLETRGNE
jgi:hypothetical protein